MTSSLVQAASAASRRKALPPPRLLSLAEKRKGKVSGDVYACGGIGAARIQVRPVCKWRLSALPVLTDLNVRSAPVLEIHHFRLGLT
jgi:hypothetical protein